MKLATTIGEVYAFSKTPAEAVRHYAGTGFRNLDYSFYSVARNPDHPLLGDSWKDQILEAKAAAEELKMRIGKALKTALAELRANDSEFAMLCELIEKNWKHHNTLLGFAMDHGCHEIDGGCGSHGLDMDEDLHIVHHFMAYPAK